jgi:SEC-C motif
VPRPGRNQPCPCGSGRKVKHCCGQDRGPSTDQLDLAFIAQQGRWAARQLADLSTAALTDLWEDLVELPQLDLSLVLPLPQLITAELQRLLDAVRNNDRDSANELIPIVLETIDTPTQRAALARAVIHLRDQRKISRRLAAAAIIDLDCGLQIVLRASLINALFIKTGRIPTPGGLRLAA